MIFWSFVLIILLILILPDRRRSPSGGPTIAYGRNPEILAMEEEADRKLEEHFQKAVDEGKSYTVSTMKLRNKPEGGLEFYTDKKETKTAEQVLQEFRNKPKMY